MYTEISINKLKHYIEEIRQCEFDIRRKRWQLSELRMSIASNHKEVFFPVIAALKKEEEALQFEEEKVKRLRLGLERVITLYINCEEEILEMEEPEKDLWDLFTVIDFEKWLHILKDFNIRYYG